jgi:hypothetical protein
MYYTSIHQNDDKILNKKNRKNKFFSTIISLAPPIPLMCVDGEGAGGIWETLSAYTVASHSNKNR